MQILVLHIIKAVSVYVVLIWYIRIYREISFPSVIYWVFLMVINSIVYTVMSFGINSLIGLLFIFIALCNLILISIFNRILKVLKYVFCSIKIEGVLFFRNFLFFFDSLLLFF